MLDASDPEWDSREVEKAEDRQKAKEEKERAILEANFASIDAANRIKVSAVGRPTHARVSLSICIASLCLIDRR